MKLELIHAARNLERIREIWEGLEAADNPSYFLSWGWIGNWVSSLPDHAKPMLMVFSEQEEPFFAFFFGKIDMAGSNFLARRKHSGKVTDRHIDEVMFCGRHLFGRRAFFINATGDWEYDRIHIEYNGFLHKPDTFFDFDDILKSIPDSWDEIYLQGFDTSRLPELTALQGRHRCLVVVDRQMLAPYVDLKNIRQQGRDYLSFLSANTRAQIKKSYRACAHLPLHLEVARDLSGALDIYDELVTLHEQTWAKRRQEGAFSTEYLYRFHNNLIQKRFDQGEIQLIRVKCGEDTAGCLYNFVYRKKVYFYQSGLNYNLCNLHRQFKPGYICHLEAIKHNLASGCDTYDFMCGGERYKMSLATHHNRLLWMRLQKPLWKFRIERLLKKINKKLRPSVVEER